MFSNSKKKRDSIRFHAKLHENRLVAPRSQRLLAAVGTVVGIVLLVGLSVGFSKLRSIWLEQCTITDMAAQVEIESGRMVAADVLAEGFGLKPGANLANIDFDARRRELLRKIPNLRELTVLRRFPNHVKITQEERIPLARLGVTKSKTPTGRVVDAEGVVFSCQRNTGMLPLIREPVQNRTAVGNRLSGRAYAALQLLSATCETNFPALTVLEIDTDHTDYLAATLGPNYSSAKIAWDGMDMPTVSARNNMLRKLKRLQQAISSNVNTGAVEWDATETDAQGRIYSRKKGSL